MKYPAPYLALPVVIAVNAVNLAGLIEKSGMIAASSAWDVLGSATLLVSTLVAALLATRLAEDNRRRAWVRRR
jgi:hypothetical protein